MKTSIVSISGFRCVPEFPEDSEFYRRIGRNIANLCLEPVGMGWDTRTTSEDIRSHLSEGLGESGAENFALGLSTTPVVSFGAKEKLYRTGVMVTSSHNPPNWNGLKVFGEDGLIIEENKLSSIIEGDARSIPREHKCAPFQSRLLAEAYMESITDLTRRMGGHSEGVKVVVDAGNGPACLVVPSCLQRLGAQVTVINGEMDGVFRRQIEPRPDALSGLSEKVRSDRADFGVAFDSDGDRAVLVDDTGSVLGEDLTLALALELALVRVPGPVVVNVATSMLVDHVCGNHGAAVRRSRVGERNVVTEMRRLGSRIGGEGSCGGLICMEHAPVRDGCLSTALVAAMLGEERRRLSDILASYPSYEQGRVSIPVDQKLVESVMWDIEQVAEGPGLDRLDGLRFAGEGWWALVRPSRTEPIVRVMAEARDKARVDELIRHYSCIVESSIRRVRKP